MIATQQQKEQIKTFFSLITDSFQDILLHPVIDEKTGVERLAVCAVDRDTETIYMLGLWFLPDDPLYKRFSFKQITPKILTERPAGFVRRILCKIKKIALLLWV